MTPSRPRRRVFLLGSPNKPDSERALKSVRSIVERVADVRGEALSVSAQEAVAAGADRIVVIGGDGTLIGVGRSLASEQVPLIGVNVGKLGFLTEFSIAELESCVEPAVYDDSLVSRRTILEVEVRSDGAIRGMSLAINDCVIQAGPPFRLVELGVSINDAELTTLVGDGLIVCTPSGSTAHNLSAGGPIVQSDLDALILTPLCPHSLTHKPLVIERSSVIDIRATRVNPGTTVIVDGQVSIGLQPGDRVVVRRAPVDLLIVRNPLHASWHPLTAKLRWGLPPNFG